MSTPTIKREIKNCILRDVVDGKVQLKDVFDWIENKGQKDSIHVYEYTPQSFIDDILCSLREESLHFLKPSKVKTSGSTTVGVDRIQGYDYLFPEITSTPALRSKKNKRRINTTMVNQSKVDRPLQSMDSTFQNNLVDIPLELSRKFEKRISMDNSTTTIDNKRQQQPTIDNKRQQQPSFCQQQQPPLQPFDVEKKGIVLPTNLEIDCQVVEESEEKANPTCNVMDKVDMDKVDVLFLVLANVYTFILQTKRVSNLLEELSLIINLLVLPFSSLSKKSSKEKDELKEKWFHSGMDCYVFSLLVIEKNAILFGHLSIQIIQALTDKLQGRVKTQFVEILKKLEQSRVHHCDEYGINVDKNGDEVTMISNTLDFSLPFNATTDSRNHYQTPELAKMYCNREEIRDSFLDLLRGFQDEKHVMGSTENFDMVTRSRNLLGCLLESNYSWFSTFFVLELLQIGISNLSEEDKSVLLFRNTDKLNAHKLEKLHRRFTLTRSKGVVKKDDFSVKTNKDQSMGTTTTTTLHSTTNQHFFFLFLKSTDSYQLNTLILSYLIEKLEELNHCQVKFNEWVKSFTEIVLKLKVLGKFIGFLIFFPHSIGSKENVLLQEKMVQINNRFLELFDVQHYLQQAIEQEHLILTLPWVTEFIQMIQQMEKDDGFYSTTTTSSSSSSSKSETITKTTTSRRNRKYFLDQILQTLVTIYTSPNLCYHSSKEINMNQLIINMQLEELFQQFDVQVPVVVVVDGWDKNKKTKNKKQEKENTMKLDNIPFLFGQRFLQKCFPEVDQLRLTLESPRKVSVSNTTILRKVRPLVVSQEKKKTNHAAGLLSEEKATEGEEDINNKNAAYSEDAKLLLQNAFFNRHSNLQKIVDFVVDNVVRNAGTFAMEQCVPVGVSKFVELFLKDNAQDISTNETKILEWMEKEKKKVIADSLQQSLQFCETHIQVAMKGLLPCSMDKKITQVVISLALEHAKCQFPSLITTKVGEEFKRNVHSWIKKTKQDHLYVASKEKNKEEQESALKNKCCGGGSWGGGSWGGGWWRIHEQQHTSSRSFTKNKSPILSLQYPKITTTTNHKEEEEKEKEKEENFVSTYKKEKEENSYELNQTDLIQVTQEICKYGVKLINYSLNTTTDTTKVRSIENDEILELDGVSLKKSIMEVIQEIQHRLEIVICRQCNPTQIGYPALRCRMDSFMTASVHVLLHYGSIHSKEVGVKQKVKQKVEQKVEQKEELNLLENNKLNQNDDDWMECPFSTIPSLPIVIKKFCKQLVLFMNPKVQSEKLLFLLLEKKQLVDCFQQKQQQHLFLVQLLLDLIDFQVFSVNQVERHLKKLFKSSYEIDEVDFHLSLSEFSLMFIDIYKKKHQSHLHLVGLLALVKERNFLSCASVTCASVTCSSVTCSSVTSKQLDERNSLRDRRQRLEIQLNKISRLLPHVSFVDEKRN